MSAGFAILLVAALAGAYGAAVSVALRRKALVAVPAVLLYLLVGMHAVFLATLSGDGRVLPGLQLNPDIAASWSLDGPARQPAFLLLALVAHALVTVQRRGYFAFLVPLPATVAFLVLAGVLGARVEQRGIVETVPGPDTGATLTIVSRDGWARIVIAVGDADARFLRVLHVHDAEGPPAEPGLIWTRDGEVLVFTARHRRLFAVDREGATTGLLPVRAHEWPPEMREVESVDTRRRLSRAEMQVGRLVDAHGGIHVR